MMGQHPGFTVATFYRFISVDEPQRLREAIRAEGLLHGLCGTVLVASEGINATIAATESDLNRFLEWLRSDDRFAEMPVRLTYASAKPFRRFKVKLKREIVTMGVEGVDPPSEAGTYVEPREWNDLISSDDVIVIDTRNDYEIGIGTFRGAINPETSSFRDFPAYVDSTLDPDVHPRVAMFCTGGIRCEKATAYLRSRGFPEVYHLKGGILGYLDSVDPSESLWDGDCFVFDERIGLDQDLGERSYLLCPGCQRPLAADEQLSTCPDCAPAICDWVNEQRPASEVETSR